MNNAGSVKGEWDWKGGDHPAALPPITEQVEILTPALL